MRKAIFSVGYYAGFFSEINNMILALMYCKFNNIEFIINSKNSAMFGPNGWEEYFLPFTKETKIQIPKKINFRMHNNKFRLKDLLRIYLYKLKTKANYMTFEIWDKFYYEYWGKENDIKHQTARSEIIQNIWKYNLKTKNNIEQNIAKLNLPQNYAAIHIRSGDKIIETNALYNPDDLMETLMNNSQHKNIFVFCDNYENYEYLKNKYKNFNFSTLCNINERGYDNEKFQSLDFTIRYKKIINLLANIEICKSSDFFVGTRHPNTDIFLSWIMAANKFILLPWDVNEYHSNKSQYFNVNKI